MLSLTCVSALDLPGEVREVEVIVVCSTVEKVEERHWRTIAYHRRILQAHDLQRQSVVLEDSSIVVVVYVEVDVAAEVHWIDQDLVGEVPVVLPVEVGLVGREGCNLRFEVVVAGKNLDSNDDYALILEILKVKRVSAD